jgi:Asp-tRNA(Asn)/Glu-tRNA(Gln) amidotransferase A subunit family amidase
MELAWVSAVDAARLIREGTVSSEELVEACLARVREREPDVQAWAFLDPGHALAQARAADEWRREGQPLGPLHGVPVGVKDIIDTADMPTENGSVLHAGRTPSRDAAVVAMLRAAGAVVMGKTVTTEFAGRAPGPTRSQTGGSTIRPASFCGVYGFKPTRGLMPRQGMLRLSQTLDHVGLFARAIEDLALLAEQLVGEEEGDPESRPRARIPYREIAGAEPPLAPMFGFVKTSFWGRVADDAKAAFGELTDHLGDRVEEVELSDAAAEASHWHRTIMEAEMAANLRAEWDGGRDYLSAPLRARLEAGRAVPAVEYLGALTRIPQLNESLGELFAQRYDALLTPAAPGTALEGLQSTGDPTFCTLWTLTGMPALSVPLLEGANGLPLGVQVVGPRHGDARLLRTVRWLVAHLAAS